MKNKAPLIIALGAPLLLVLLVVVGVYVPKFFAPQPTINFLYMTGDYYYPAGYRYDVEGTHVVRESLPSSTQDRYYPKPVGESNNVRFFTYDVTANKGEEVTFEDAAKLTLDARVESRDGFRVTQGSGGGDFLFFDGGSYGTYYITNGTRSEKLNLGLGNYYYNFRFLGWIES